MSANDTFTRWVQQFKQDAVKQGISDTTARRALKDLTPVQSVLEKDENQAEFTIKFDTYSGWFLTRKMVKKGRRLYRENRSLLNDVSVVYGVAPRYILAIWGIESRYGKGGKNHSVIRALATLAFRSSRSHYFRDELIQVLRILDEHDKTPDALKGSWAGAMGQPQFMPSSYRHYAEDFDGDGFANIWSSKPDIFASIAHYLSSNGWKADVAWGKRLSEEEMNKGSITGEIIKPDGENGPAFRVNDNFQVLLNYNPSHHYALTVGLLADRIGKVGNKSGEEQSTETAN
ncbi:MAG: lytic transglycosylase domain-containing protein [bacterium]